MTADLLEIVPERHRAAVAGALRRAFGNVPMTAFTQLSGGRSGTLIYRVDMGDVRSVVRLVAQPNALNDPARQFAAMTVASDEGIAPYLHYDDAESGIAITDFVQAVPWSEAFASGTTTIAALGAQIRRLHGGPAIAAFLDAFQCIDGGLETLRGAGATLPPMLRAYLPRFDDVRRMLAPHVVLVSSHNDLNPGNLLYDGARLWIIDWEAAWQNDEMFDVATVLHWFGMEGEREEALLRGYFGAEPTALQRAKLELTRQVVLCYYGLIFLLLTLQAGEVIPALDPEPDTLPTFAETRLLLATGKLPLGNAAQRTEFSLIMINDAMRRMAAPSYGAAVATLAGAV
ncbi:MAG TPA: phosphotransferase [Gemmatimonadales bacterium]